MNRILDSSEDMTDGMNSESEAQASSSTANDELKLPKGTYIVEKIINHERFDKLKRNKLIDQRRKARNDSLFFQVQWKGYTGQDTWEPLQTVYKLDAFKNYAREQNLAYLIPQESDNSDSENAATTDEDDEVKGLESDVEKSQGKACFASVPKSRKRHSEVRDEKENVGTIKYAIGVQLKKTWWLRSGEKKKKCNGEKVLKRKLEQDLQCHEDEKKRAKKMISRCGLVRKYIEPIIKYRKHPKRTENVGFIVNTRRTRSLSPVADKVLRKQVFSVKDAKNFRDDAKFLEGTRISTAIAQVEQAVLEKKLQDGWILRYFWKKIDARYHRVLVGQIRNAKPRDLEKILAKIMYDFIDMYCAKLRRHWTEQNAFKLKKDVQHLKVLCDHSGKNFEAIVFDAITLSETGSLIIKASVSNCEPKHHVCGTFKILLSSFSWEYRVKMFEFLRRETSNRLLDIASSGGQFCFLDTLISFGANVGFAKSRAIQQSVANGDEEMALHLILKGFELNVELGGNSNSEEKACEVLRSLEAYRDRFKLKMEKWSFEMLKLNCMENAYPISGTYVHRIGQLDRKICLTVSSNKPSPETKGIANELQVLVIHSIGLLSAPCIKEIGIKRRCPPIHLPKHLKFRLGARVDKMDLTQLLEKRGSYIYWFPEGLCRELNARVHIQLSYTPAIYGNDPDDLLVLQLWDVQMYPPMAPSLSNSD